MKALPMSMVGFPLLLIPLAICNIVVFLMPGLSFSAPLFTLPLMSGVGWAVTLSDALLALGILMLLFEVIKGARPGAKYIMDHLLSLIVFGGAAAEFLLLPQFGTSTYFLLTSLALVDFLSGIALRTRRPRVASVAAASASSSSAATAKVVRAQYEAPPEPRFDRAPAPPVPSAEPKVEPIVEPKVEPKAEPIVEPKVESAPPAPVEPIIAHSDGVATESSQQPAHEPSPEIQSPGIQPSSGAHPSSDNPQR
jgi:outer membrane biosynthesis protein TonB